MNHWQQAVRNFNLAMGQEIHPLDALPRFPSMPSAALFLGAEEDGDRGGLLEEELGELREAFAAGDLAGFVDAGVDTLYVLLGLMNAAGVNLNDFFDEVHEANMAKLKGPKRADGKQLKPPGWKPPDIQGILDRLKWQQDPAVRAAAAKALHDHVEVCERCSGPHDGCHKGQELEGECFDHIGFDPYQPEYAPVHVEKR